MINIKPTEIEYTKMYTVEETHWWYRGLRRVLLHWINKVKPPRILDAGCGTGMNMQKLTALGYEVHGLDYSENALVFCKERGLENLKQGLLEALPYGDSYFDCIYSIDVLGSLDPEKVQTAVNEFYRCLKLGGYLIVNCAAFEFLRSGQDRAWHIKKRYTRRELKDIFERCNFSITKSTYRVFFLFPLVLVAKLLRRKSTTSDTDKTNFLIDLLFFPIMHLEGSLLKFISFPFGSSVFLVAIKEPSA